MQRCLRFAPHRRPTAHVLEKRLRPHFTRGQASIPAEVIEETHQAIVRDSGMKVGQLAEAQKRTAARIGELVGVVKEGERELGGLASSFGYAFENEVYRSAPRILEEEYGTVLRERMIRAILGGEEINLHGRGRRDGQEVWVGGEAKVRLDEITGKKADRKVFDNLDRKIRAVRAKHGAVAIVPLLVTRMATPAFLKEAKRRGVIAIQSFEW